MKTVLVSIKIKAIELFSNSTSHAVSGIFKAKSDFLKLLWFIAVIASTSLFAALVSEDIMNYLKFPVTTNIRYINEKMIDFPLVGICNTNPYTTKAAIDYLKEKFETSYNLTKTKNTSNLEFVNKIFEIYKDEELLTTALRIDYLLMNFSMINSIGMRIEDLIISCKFNGIKCNLSKDFVQYLTFQNGVCYFYNTLGNKNTIGSLPGYGLELELFSGFEEMQPYFSDSHGFELMILNQTFDLFFEYHAKRFPLRKNVYVDLTYETTFVHKLKFPYSECEVDSDIPDSVYAKKLIENSIAYTAEFCMELAYIHETYQGCNCSYTSEYFNAPTCRTLNEINCLVSFSLPTGAENGAENDKVCPLECKSSFFKLAHSSKSYPTKRHADYLLRTHEVFNRSFDLNRSLTTEDISKSVSKIKINSYDSRYMVVTEMEAITLVDLISNIGGLLGLFMGMSLLSFVEVLELLVVIFLEYRK